MKKISVGIVGAGEIAQNFHLPILKSLPNVELSAIADRVVSKASYISDKFGIQRICKSYEELLSQEDIEAILILTPTDLHADYAVQAIQARKNLFIEKPIAQSYHEALKIKDALYESDLKVMIGMSQRFRQDARVLKTYISKGELGDLFYIKSGWLQKKQKQSWKEDKQRTGGGVLMDLGLSLVDSILWMFDFKPVKSVSASNFSRTNDADIEDISVGTIHFKDGSIATMECSWSLYTKITNFYFNAYGKEGSALINPLQIFKKNGDLLQPQVNSDKIGNLQIHQKSYETELKHFINSILGLAPTISTVDEALISLKILEAMYQSAKEGKEIMLTS